MGASTSRVASRPSLSDALARRFHINRFRLSKLVFAYVGLLPVLVIFTYLRVLPILRTFQFSLYQSNLINPVSKFTGISNFTDLLHDQLFWLAIRNTTIFAIANVSFSVLIALGLGLLLARRSFLGGFWETIYFLPVITAWVPVAVVWKWIYDPSYGLLNYVLSWFGIQPIGWLINIKYALIAVIILSVWKTIGYNMMIFLVGIRDIPGEYYDAAQIDGANSRGLLRYITLPLLRPILLFVTIISTISAYNVFTSVYILTTGSQGAQGNGVRTLVFDIYENAFRYFKYGYASAEAVCLFVIVIILTALQFRIGRSQE
jgi:multiple sugar transport system permease protein